MCEFYDAAVAPAPGFVLNTSLRGRTAPGIDTMIGGLVVNGTGPLPLLLRVVGPELSSWGVPTPLADPALALFDRWWTPIARNDDWERQAGGSLPALVAATRSTGAFDLAPGSKSAALVAALDPGAYTIHATGANGTAGEVLLEIYVVEE